MSRKSSRSPLSNPSRNLSSRSAPFLLEPVQEFVHEEKGFHYQYQEARPSMVSSLKPKGRSRLQRVSSFLPSLTTKSDSKLQPPDSLKDTPVEAPEELPPLSPPLPPTIPQYSPRSSSRGGHAAPWASPPPARLPPPVPQNELGFDFDLGNDDHGSDDHGNDDQSNDDQASNGVSDEPPRIETPPPLPKPNAFAPLQFFPADTQARDAQAREVRGRAGTVASSHGPGNSQHSRSASTPMSRDAAASTRRPGTATPPAEAGRKLRSRQSWLGGGRPQSRMGSKDFGRPQKTGAWVMTGDHEMDYNLSLLSNGEKVGSFRIIWKNT